MQVRRKKATPPTWEAFKARVRKIDRDSLLREAGAASAIIAQHGQPAEWGRLGLTPWSIADVARTALAWGSFNSPRANADTLLHLCNMNVLLGDEAHAEGDAPEERLGRILARTFLEQFPSQRNIAKEVARTLLLFGRLAEHPPAFKPEAMVAGWFETLFGGLTLDEYVESVFLVSVLAQGHEGGFSAAWLETPGFQALSDVFSLEAVQRTFNEHLVSTVIEFKEANRAAQDPLPPALKKYAFNRLTNRPFIEGVVDIALAPSVQAVIAKALPPAIYHEAWPALGDGFTRDLGAVFQHYVGRQLALIEGERAVLPEVPYGPKKDRRDSCDWFLDLPGLTVLIECKARQPIESLRVGGPDWLSSVQGSIGKGIGQLNRSNEHIDRIAQVRNELDPAKARVGLVVTLEPFYLNQNWMIWDFLPKADFPVGVISIAELEALVTLDADELGQALLAAASDPRNNVLLVNSVLDEADGRGNPLLEATWEAIPLFARVEAAATRLAESD